MKCLSCGRYNFDDALYCRICGEKLDKCQKDNYSYKSSVERKKKKTLPEWVNIGSLIVFAVVALVISFLIVDSFGWLYKEVGFGPSAHDELSKGGIMLMLLLAYGLWYALGFLYAVITEALGYE